MWFEFNIIIFIIIVITKMFCIFATFTILENNSKDYYEVNPITRKIMSLKGGKIICVFFLYFCLFVWCLWIIIIQIFAPRLMWILSIVLIISVILIMIDCINDIYLYIDSKNSI